MLGLKESKHSLANFFFCIQDTQIRLIKVSKHFYPKMPTGILFCGISTGLIIISFLFQCDDLISASESDIYRRHILTSNVSPRAKRF